MSRSPTARWNMATNKPNPQVAHKMDDAEMESLLYQALLKDGRVIPHTPEEVALVNELLAGQVVELPPELLDPEAVLRGSITPRSLPISLPFNPEAVHQLASAARNGSEIPPEVRQRMEADRNTAEGSGTDGSTQP